MLSHINQTKDHTFRGHTDSVDQLCWHPTNPDVLATASGDKTVRLWDARCKKSVATINTKGWNNKLWTLGMVIVTVGRNGLLFLWLI